MPDDSANAGPVSRRTLLRLGAAGGAGAALVAAQGWGAPFLAQRGLLSADGAFAATSTALSDGFFYLEKFPTSPLIISPFTDPLPIPRALAPVLKSAYSAWSNPPGPGTGQQNSLRNERHQCWPGQIGYPDPIVYKIDVLLRTHAFTTSQVLPIDADGKPTASFDSAGTTYSPGTVRTLPLSTIYGFNGTFPGPMINAEYGKPALVRFENHLDENPLNLDRQDFGSPDWSFLTHLHNGHTAPESDGNPHYSMVSGPKHPGFLPQLWVDNLYLNWPAGGDDREKQSFFWFHDHTMDHTGSNVYKGLVGLYPIYDPKNGMDMGDERRGLRLPGVRTDNPDGSFDVKYDIPLAFSDFRLDDGDTVHKDIHDGLGEFPAARNPAKHPEWWGKTFYKHFPNHGFVGDMFTVNGTASPVLEVKRRKYRFRFLDASVSRIYEFKLMSSTLGPKSSASLGYKDDELEGQYRIEDGQQCIQFTQIASDGGLLPFPIKRDSFELWPAKRREVIVDFTRYQDGTPTTKGDVIYLTNVLKMPNGRMWSNSSRFFPDPNYKVPMLKFVIGDNAPDDSQIPAPQMPLRPLPPLPNNWRNLLDNRLIFEVKRGSLGGETEWLINGKPFDPTTVLTSLKNKAGATPPARQKKNSFNLWEIRNGGGGWVHPFHLHMEEHRTVMRNGKDVTSAGNPGHPDDVSKEDLVALDPDESVIIYRGFRDFVGPYVAHCHNLAHEDHAMMFGWEITP
ncbi:multicopper oxidase domain-containing protein [Pseudarthrobacter psychrotolerans]|uniref:Multicopper oxidase CueO n=1 Tax=Pseudarthrobacter psychrotolerans TaxID=2697569 RepID=A0A6P1NMX6_9MICC|nr:multicopper oxidase domain-containing protein [Pseudarthrobacter psychrotolerans]QHK20989.1 multicopper oxidase domain-containing protein [Pseudarthrobacter psychrotolerans]